MSKEDTKRAVGGMAALLSRSRIFQDYEAAFTKASGLPLVLREPRATHDSPAWVNHNEFCALMAKEHKACAACYELQCQLEKDAAEKPCTLKCFAGLCESAVPVHVGGKLAGFLETGHVFTRKPTHKLFSKVAREILSHGIAVDLKQAQDAWLATRTLSPAHYEGFVAMLSIFARHLEQCGGALALDADSSADPAMEKAREFIAVHSAENLSLKEVARLVNLSAHYFCRRFKQAVGLSFVDYIARVRVAKAEQLLRDPALRIGEVAFQSGFQSVSQFNRVFRKLAGRSPSQARRAGFVASAN